MSGKLITFSIGLCAFGLFAQDGIKEPEYVNQYFVLIDGKIQPLERQNMKMQAQMKKRFVYNKATSAEVVDGTQSSVRVAPNAHFVVRMDVGDMDPSTMIFLKRFTIGKNDRELVMSSHSSNMVTGPNVQKGVGDDTTVPLTVNKYGTKSFEIIPSQPLAPGEYLFSPTATGLGASQVYCFGVAPKS